MSAAKELHLVVRAGADLCALPVGRVRRIVRELAVSPLPGAAPELKGLAEFGGEPMPVLDLVRLVGAAPGANPTYPLIVVAWAGPDEHRELVGFAVDAVLEVAAVAPETIVPAGRGLVRGDASIGGRAVRILDPEELRSRAVSRMLLLRRAGGLWALGHEEVQSVERRGGEFRVMVEGGELAVDAVLGVVEGLETTPAGPVLRQFWREPVRGLAVHGARPLVVLDPGRPPSVFAPDLPEGSDG